MAESGRLAKALEEEDVFVRHVVLNQILDFSQEGGELSEEAAGRIRRFVESKMKDQQQALQVRHPFLLSPPSLPLFFHSPKEVSLPGKSQERPSNDGIMDGSLTLSSFARRVYCAAAQERPRDRRPGPFRRAGHQHGSEGGARTAVLCLNHLANVTKTKKRFASKDLGTTWPSSKFAIGWLQD